MLNVRSLGLGSERDQARFYAQVALPNEQGCMLWRGKPGRNGYGRLRVAGRTVGAHRYAYVLAHGPIPEGLVIDHVKAKGCTSTLCVAPAHLEAVTTRVNTLRGQGLAAQNARKTHCKRGHPLSGDNLYIKPDGSGRNCRACLRSTRSAYQRRRKAC